MKPVYEANEQYAILSQQLQELQQTKNITALSIYEIRDWFNLHNINQTMNIIKNIAPTQMEIFTNKRKYKLVVTK